MDILNDIRNAINAYKTDHVMKLLSNKPKKYRMWGEIAVPVDASNQLLIETLLIAILTGPLKRESQFLFPGKITYHQGFAYRLESIPNLIKGLLSFEPVQVFIDLSYEEIEEQRFYTYYIK